MEKEEPLSSNQVQNYCKRAFKAGTLSNKLEFWRTLTSDPYILQSIKGYKIEFARTPRELYGKKMHCQKFSLSETLQISKEIEKLLSMGVIEQAEHIEDQILSPIFLTSKKDGSKRMILNLKKLNSYMDPIHFKMENIHEVKNIVSNDDYFASVDLEKAYYSVSIHVAHRRYLRFQFQGKLYEFTALPNGISTAPRLFTKLLKVLFSSLRKDGFSSIVYIDDCLLIAKNSEQSFKNIKATLELMQNAGFYINWEKSVLVPVQCIEFLGFVIDSRNMTLKINSTKVNNLIKKIRDILSKKEVYIQEVASVLGSIISILPAYSNGKLHYRALEKCKILALQKAKGDFNKTCMLSQDAIEDLGYWLNYIDIDVGAPIIVPDASVEMFTDASMTMWGAELMNGSVSESWTKEELELCHNNINALETLTVFLALKKFVTRIRNKYVMVRSDNMTAVQYINNMGGHKSQICNVITRELWKFCIDNGIYIKAAHIPGVDNVKADFLSRLDKNTEWEISDNVFETICMKFGTPAIDLFASVKNRKCGQYVSWKPDKCAIAIDAFTLDWNFDEITYAFPPFSMLAKLLQKRGKIELDRRKQHVMIIIYPEWSTQTWFPQLQQMLLQCPLKLPVQPFTTQHPMERRLRLMSGVI